LPKRARCPHCDRLFNREALDIHVQKCRSQSKSVKKVGKSSKKRLLVIDGNNVAYSLSPQGRPKAQNLVLAYQSLTSAGHNPVFVISAALVHNIDKPEALSAFILSANVDKAPQGTNDDLRIIQLSKKLNADIISNDRFLDWIDQYPWITSRLRRYRMTPAGLILVN
jgi:uncharacterized C2H2 Zn-finger protein